MSLKSEQHSQIATAYEKAAADPMMPAPQRKAFARKAEWFRLLAQIGARKEAKAVSKEERSQPSENLRALDENINKKRASQ
jgi:hypothetical protein